MRKLKRYMALVLVITVFMNLCVVSMASEGRVSQEFVNVCNGFFETEGQYKAYNKTGDDVTEDFLRENKYLYECKDYVALHEAFLNELSYFSWEEVNLQMPSVPSTRAMVPVTKTGYIYRNKTNNTVPQTTFEYMLGITGTYYVDNGRIVEKGSTNTWVQAFHIGGDFTYQTQSLSGYQVISADKYSVKLYAQVTFKIFGQYYSEVLGPYTDYIVAYA